jgi:hypothetical protein
MQRPLRKDINLTANWALYTMKFDELLSSAGGNRSLRSTLLHLYAVQFQVGKGTTFDVWLDDVAFLANRSFIVALAIAWAVGVASGCAAWEPTPARRGAAIEASQGDPASARSRSRGPRPARPSQSAPELHVRGA